MAKKSTTGSDSTAKNKVPEQGLSTSETLVPDDQHPSYLAAILSEGPSKLPVEDRRFPWYGEEFERTPLPVPSLPIPQLLNICNAVSGSYKQEIFLALDPFGSPQPKWWSSLIVRVDVDRFYPQNLISVEMIHSIPSFRSHIIAEVTSDRCVSHNHRIIEGKVTYRDGAEAVLAGTHVVFEAIRGKGTSYEVYTLKILGGTPFPVEHHLSLISEYFDSIEFEVDYVDNAGEIVAAFDTNSHPNRPTDLPKEVISIESVFRRAGFDVSFSPATSSIPLSGAGVNGRWSNSELHNAMQAYWSRFMGSPLWAMWVLFAGEHEDPDTGGVMFDNIGPNHRQGVGVFTKAFNQGVQGGDPIQVAWLRRYAFFALIHEVGHAFNLAHSFQKTLPTPWMIINNELEARSFMNYPTRVARGINDFFKNFYYRFSDSELIFMRHAPRRFVQMGNSNWLTDHAFEAPKSFQRSTDWTLDIHTGRTINEFAFLEPVNLEITLTNSSSESCQVDAGLLKDGKSLAIWVGRNGGVARQWRPFIDFCIPTFLEVSPGMSVQGSHLISTSTHGWLIDEPGFYNIQVAVEVNDDVLFSEVLTIFVSPPSTREEARVALDYFTEDVGRVLVFKGAPELEKATATLHEVIERLPSNPVSRHAAIATSSPLLRDYKRLEVNKDRSLRIKTTGAEVEAAAKVQHPLLIGNPEEAAEALGDIAYYEDVRALAEAMEKAGDKEGASEILDVSLSTMRKRGVQDFVIERAEQDKARMVQ